MTEISGTTAAAPLPVLALDSVDSTNAEARRQAESGDLGPRWITARVQTAGRGRRGRAWSTTEGNLAATLLTTPDRAPGDAARTSFVAAVAVALIVTGLSMQRYEIITYRASLAKTVAMVTTAPPPSVDALENLDAIQRMGQSAHADGELLADLQ